jgi:hypothetical protein
VNDDDPGDYAFPRIVALDDYDPEEDADVRADMEPLRVGESVTVCGGFTITRIW